jgi:gliding motility-associated protein GldC
VLAAFREVDLFGWIGAGDCAMTSRTAEISVAVDLDADNLATRIAWRATEAPGAGAAKCDSMMLSLWDSEKKSTAAIDLWTREMTVEDMNSFVYQVLHKVADTYLRATKNAALAQSIHEFGDEFGRTCGISIR